MSHVFGRNTRVNPPLVKGGKGVYLHDSTGKRYLDACGGAAVSCFGHGTTAIIEAVKNQLDNIAYAHTSFFTSEPAENLASRLCDAAPEGIDRVYFVSGGSEAIEASEPPLTKYTRSIPSGAASHSREARFSAGSEVKKLV